MFVLKAFFAHKNLLMINRNRSLNTGSSLAFETLPKRTLITKGEGECSECCVPRNLVDTFIRSAEEQGALGRVQFVEFST